MQLSARLAMREPRDLRGRSSNVRDADLDDCSLPVNRPVSVFGWWP